MAMGKCEHCGAEEYMPFVCKFCRGRYCAAHRLPENHGCQGLEAYRERVRAEGRLVAPEPDLMTPRMSTGARLDAHLSGLFRRIEGKAAYGALAIMVASYLLGYVLVLAGQVRLYDAIFILDRGVLFEPWTIITSLFAHSLAGFSHLFGNGLILFFFGPAVERLIGTRRFVYLFLGAGAAAGILQLVVFNYLLAATVPSYAYLADGGVLGASGAILALLGTLTVLAPRLTILLFFIVPAPLWAITALYAFVDVLGVLNPGSGIAHLAHLGGLTIGLLYGRRLHAQGLRAHAQRPTSMSRKYF